MTDHMQRLLAPLVALALVAIAPSSARAGEAAAPKSDAKAEAENESKAARATLADKVPPVSGNVFFKKGRFEVAPSVGLSLGDAFFQKYAFGLMINYHVLESFSIGLHGSYLLNTPGGAVNVCSTNADGSEVCKSPSMNDLGSVPGKVSLVAGLDLAWSPFYGKVNIMAEKVLHFDTSIFIGADVIQYAAYDKSLLGNKDTFTGGGHIGIGERVVFNEFLALRIELRDYMYGGVVNIEDASGKPQTQFQNQLMLELGLSFFLGSGSKD
ncbi:MAG TPA: outer membrane beta-barrel domain-containing protein [Myxococcales bacterium]|jgi:outer membrane beta-barrel protein